MICLDTNYLIRGLIDSSREAHELVAWTRAGEPLITPMLVWFEFRCGPVTATQIAAMRAFLGDIVVLDETQVSRPRGSSTPWGESTPCEWTP